MFNPPVVNFVKFCLLPVNISIPHGIINIDHNGIGAKFLKRQTLHYDQYST